MEDGSDGLTSTATAVLRSPVRNGEIMANFPDVNEEVAPASPIKVNGDTKSDDESDSSDCDALIIDERPQKSKKPERRGFKGFKKTTNDSFVHTNPYFAESIFDLLEKSQKRDDKKSSHPKLREYAQYLGLQPTVQFKCSKCSRSGFPTLATLNDHLTQCNDSSSVPVTDTPNVNVSGSTNIRVTRKVFLCSACGTYYENWNLFLHMREVHKRYICLYCLGMFSHPDKLAVHIVSKHNCVPNHVTTLDEFYDLHADPCFLMCCECQRGFTERDNFFNHDCCIETKKTPKSIRPNNKVTTKSKSIEHVTADSVDEIVTTCKDDAKTEEDTAAAEVNVDDESKVVTVETEICDNSMSNCDVTQEVFETAVVESEPVEDESVTTMDEVVEEAEHSDAFTTVPEEEETRKVPKVTLKLPKTFETDDLLVYESDDSEKLTMEVDDDDEVVVNDDEVLPSDLQVAGPDVSIVELELEQPLDKFDIKLLLQKCLQSTIPTCVYCNHARRISVNGKQLGLHAIAEHRFSAIVNSITAEELIPESFVARIRDCLPELENVFFNLEASASEEAVTFSHVFECFQCRYATTIHKELYLHNRKMHAKSILLCIMCKSNFYSYSELICHLCPGLYELDNDVRFRCCMCVSDELPSAFRLMVHLRKRHHVCDVCLEQCHNQSRLSNHVWKHKLHHLCYRCGIAYRNKPDITKHLYWKHGTESVLCKKCLQKKWPHVYHFCILPPTFTCEECNLSFTRAVSLMVHKRLHVNLKPHACNEPNCTEQFISKKLLLKHEFKHREPPEETTIKTQDDEVVETAAVVPIIENTEQPENGAAEVDDKSKPKVDVYDLPELNLSESDSSDSDDEVPEVKEVKNATVDAEKPVLGTIWDDFRNYQATKVPDETEPVPLLQVILSDHDYCVAQNASSEEAKEMTSGDHDYCFGAAAVSTKKKTPSGTSSSDSDSSSCTCGSNCSCSSSTSSSSSDSSESDSSTSVGRRRQQERRERRKLKTKSKKPTKDNAAIATTDPQTAVVKLEVPIQESDLETTESDTDEDFYDKQPQKLANKLLAEKKNQLLQLAAIGPYINGSIMDGSRPPTPNLPMEEPSKPKKKSKSKKRKKKNKSSKYESENPNNAAAAAVNIPIPAPVQPSLTQHDSQYDSSQNLDDSSLRASKRRRVPNKFYGYSSDEDQDKIPQPPVFKWRKVDLPSPKSPLIVPPITIKSVLTPTPTVDPISIRTTATTGELCVHVPTVSQQQQQQREHEAVSESNDSSSSSEEEPQQQVQLLQPPPPAKEQPALYCYCRCPYDEVSEMIGCDASDCAIEWFHFECVGIMVPPKGQWFCPDCRKKKQQRREMLLQNQTRDCLNIN